MANWLRLSGRALGLMAAMVVSGPAWGQAAVQQKTPSQQTAPGQVPLHHVQAGPATPRGFDYWQPDWMVRELWGPGRMPKSMMVRLLRHTTYIQFGVPDEFAGAKSTITADRGAIASGAKLYQQHCSQCHGVGGTGGGDGGLALSPSPALLAYMIQRPVAVDEYLLWSIGDGGKQFGSNMPAFKDQMSREDIWRVIAFMRGGFDGLLEGQSLKK